MRKGRFSEEQIIKVLKEHQAGIPIVELCRKHGISDATFYTWRSKYAGMEVSDARKLKALERGRPMRSVADIQRLPSPPQPVRPAQGQQQANGTGLDDNRDKR